jgi:hypothetical protein
MKKIAFLMLAVGVVAFSACKEDEPVPTPATATLYEQLGGKLWFQILLIQVK